MAVAIDRSLNSELLEGATDGTIKKLRPDISSLSADISDAGRSLLAEGVNRYGMEDGRPREAQLMTGLLRRR